MLFGFGPRQGKLIVPKFRGPRRVPTCAYGTAKILFAATLLSLVGLACGNVTAASVVNGLTAPSAAVGLGPTFAIADFDGDGRPDIAAVEVGNDLSAVSYRIQVQLSSSGWHTLQITAPPGGLLIEPRDVNNGNHFIDLVVTTAISRQAVAILINDGAGRFLQVGPTAFPDAFADSNTSPVLATQTTNVAIEAPLQHRPGTCLKAGSTSQARLKASRVTQWSSVFVFPDFLISHSGRAPPLAVHRSSPLG
jgi:hypothetical protein